MSKYIKLNIVNRKECVFVWFYALNGKPYHKHLAFNKRDVEEIPTILSVLRFDGTFGTVGGKVEKDETLLQALHRECIEEIGYEIKDIESNVRPLATFFEEETGYLINSFTCRVDYEELVKIRNNAVNSSNSLAECSGYNLIHCVEYKGNLGIEQFLKQQFSATAKMELELMLENLKHDLAFRNYFGKLEKNIDL